MELNNKDQQKQEALRKTLRGRVNREWLKRELYYSFQKARKGKLATADEYNFDMDYMENLERLTDEILDARYEPSRGVAFVINKPVIREIFAAPFRDRIVHHFLYSMVADWWDTRLIKNSFSCRKGKGTLYGIHQLEKDIRSVTTNYQQRAYVIKLDIQGYFMSLPRKELFKKMAWGLRKQYPKGGPNYQLVRYLWERVIFDDPVRDVKLRPPLSAWDKLPKNKSLLNQPEGQGIVIGNLSSQLLSNIYLDQLDRYVTRMLGYKHYGRYVDDFYIVVPEERFPQAKRDVKLIEDYLAGMGLILHPQKRHMQPAEHGVEFLGAVIYPHRTVPGRRFKGSFYQAVREYEMGYRKDDSIASYLGYCSNFNAQRLCSRVFESVGWDYQYGLLERDGI